MTTIIATVDLIDFGGPPGPNLGPIHYECTALTN